MRDPFSVLRAKAYAAFDLGNYDQCEQLIMEALALQPNDFSVLSLLCRVRYLKSDYGSTREISRHLIETAPDDSEGYLFLAWGTIDDHNDHPDNAVFDSEEGEWKIGFEARMKQCRELLERCFELDPTDPRHYMLKAKLAYLGNQPQQVIDSADEGLRFAPENDTLHHYRILGFDQKRDAASLKQALIEQLARSPDDGFAHHRMAKISLEEKKTDEAVSHARDAIRLNPDEEEYKDAYWDAVMASNPWVRPFVYIRYSVQWFHRIPGWAQTCVILGVGLILGIAYIFAERTSETASSLVICFSVMTLILFSVAVASERPFMAVFDLIYYFRDSGYRISTRNEKRNENFAMVGTFLAAVVVLTSAAFKTFLPVALLLLSIPLASIYFAKPWMLRLSTIAMTMVAMFLLWKGMTLFPESGPRTADRIYAMYYFFGFISICITAGVTTQVLLTKLK